MNRWFVPLAMVACALAMVRPGMAQQEAVARFLAARERALAAPPADVAAAASEALDGFLRIEHGSARDQLLEQAALMALAAGKPATGLQLIESALAVHGPGVVRTGIAVRCLGAMGRLTDLVKLCREADGTGRDAAVFAAMDAPQLAQLESCLLPLAERALREGRAGEGLYVFEALVQADPENAIRLANLALTLRHLGRRSESAAAYRQAMEVAPGDDQIRSDHGLFLRAQGDWVGAAVELRRALALESVPGMGPAITNLVQMETLRPGSAGIDALAGAAKALAVRPDAAMLRRVTLDLLGDRLRNPDKRPVSR